MTAQDAARLEEELLEAAAEAGHDAAFGPFSPWATLDEISRNMARVSTKAALEVFRREHRYPICPACELVPLTFDGTCNVCSYDIRWPFSREQGARDETLREKFDECYGWVNRGWSVMRRVAREEATDEDINDASMCLARAKTRVMVLAELTLGVAAPASPEVE